MREWPLRVLSGFLLIWEPLNFSGEVAATMSSIGMRGAYAAVEALAAHAGVAVLTAGTGWALWTRNPDGIRIASFAVTASALRTIQSLYWTVLPQQTFPGQEWPFAAIALLHAGGWVWYLQRWSLSDCPSANKRKGAGEFR